MCIVLFLGVGRLSQGPLQAVTLLKGVANESLCPGCIYSRYASETFVVRVRSRERWKADAVYIIRMFFSSTANVLPNASGCEYLKK